MDYGFWFMEGAQQTSSPGVSSSSSSSSSKSSSSMQRRPFYINIIIDSNIYIYKQRWHTHVTRPRRKSTDSRLFVDCCPLLLAATYAHRNPNQAKKKAPSGSICCDVCSVCVCVRVCVSILCHFSVYLVLLEPDSPQLKYFFFVFIYLFIYLFIYYSATNIDHIAKYRTHIHILFDCHFFVFSHHINHILLLLLLLLLLFSALFIYYIIPLFVPLSNLKVALH